VNIAPALVGLVAGAADTLPVSVAAHLLVVRAVQGSPEAHASYHDVVVQLGTSAGVAAVYTRQALQALQARRLHRGTAASSDARQSRAGRLARLLLLASLPTLVLSGVVAPLTTRLLYDPRSIALALALGGLCCIAFAFTAEGATTDVLETTPRQAALIGLLHPLSFWPGTSHVLVGWLGGRLAGLSTRAAYEFALLLSLGSIAPVCLVNAVTGYDRIGADGHGAVVLVLLAAAVGAALMVTVVRRALAARLVALFGGYRIALAAVVFMLVETVPQ